MFTKKKNKEYEYIRNYISAMYPVMIIGQLIAQIAPLIDTTLTGCFLGKNALAAVGVSSPVVSLVMAIVLVFSAGNSIVCSNSVGKGEIKEAQSVFSMTIFLSTLIAFVLSVVVLFQASSICVILGADHGSEIAAMARDYLSVMALSIPAVGFVMIAPNVLQLEGDRLTGLLSIITLVATDIVFDLLNVYLFKGGVRGMAFASVISYYLSFFVVLLAFIRKRHRVSFSIVTIRFNRTLEVISYGIPLFIQTFGSGIVFSIINNLLLKNNDSISVAAFSVIKTIGFVLLVFTTGMNIITTSTTAIFYGENNRAAINQLLKNTMIKILKINIVIIIIVLIAAPVIVIPFSDSELVREAAATGLRIYSLQLLFIGIVQVYAGYLKGIKKLLSSSFLLFIQVILSGLLAVVFASFTDGMNILFSYVAAAFFTFVISFIYVFIKSKKVSLKIENITLLPDSFDPKKEDIIKMNVNNMDEVIELSKATATFVKNHNGTSKKTMLVPLFIEEICGNVIKHGFNDNKQHFLEVKVIYKDGKFIIRTRDDCIPFDAEDFYKMHMPDEPEKNIGIRMVCKLAEEFVYLNTLRLNNMIIKV